MSRKSQKTHLTLRPVSQNAYNSFIDRISRVMPSSHSKEAVVSALDRYLAGDYGYVDALTDNMRMIFEMLRFDVDKAIERSTRARNRRRPRKANKSVTKSDAKVKSAHTSGRISEPAPIDTASPADIASPLPDATAEADETPEEIHIPRRLSRAAAHALRPKHRWQRIG